MEGDIPELYFTPTAAELKAVQSSLAARTQSLANAPLRTQAMRDADQKAREARWPTVRLELPLRVSLRLICSIHQTKIRVRFSDRSQLEKTFPSTHKIRSVYAFVRGLLREDVKSVKFVLCELFPPVSKHHTEWLSSCQTKRRQNGNSRSPILKCGISISHSYNLRLRRCYI